MVARTPPKPKKKIVAPLDPIQLRETVNKVERCMARLQELQYITGGTKVISGVNLSPRSTRGYLKTSLRCKQESLRIRNANGQKSSPGRLPSQIGEWKRMSLPAMILGETVGEILQASQFAREIVTAVETGAKKVTTGGDPRTPVTDSRRNSRLNPETTELRARRKREKRIIRSDPHSPLLERAKSRINFKVSGSPPKKEIENEKGRFSANRVSPKNRPWARKTVIFPNPLFHSTPTSQNQKFCSRTRSPVITRTRQTTPHKFLIKTPPPPAAVAKFHVKIRSPTISVSPTRPRTASAKKKAISPPKNVSMSTKLRRSFSPSRLATRLASPLKIRNPPICVSPTRPGMATVKKKSISPPRTVTGRKKSMSPPPRTATVKKSMSPPKKVSTAAKLRRSFSPSRLASRLVSPLKSRKSSVQKSVDSSEMMMNMMSGLKQRPLSTTMPMHLPARRI